MKVKVVSIFRDKDTPKKIIELGTELNVSKERYEEIKEYVEIINTTDKKETERVEN